MSPNRNRRGGRRAALLRVLALALGLLAPLGLVVRPVGDGPPVPAERVSAQRTPDDADPGGATANVAAQLSDLLDSTAGRSDPGRPAAAGAPAAGADPVAQAARLLSELPAERAVGAIVAWAGPAPTLAEAVLAVRLTGAIEDREALAAAVRILDTQSPGHLARPYVAARVAPTLAALVALEGAIDVLDREARSAGAPVLVLCVDAVGSVRSRAALRALDRLRGRDAALDRAVVAALGRLDPRGAPLLDDCAHAVRPALTDADAGVRRAAAVAVGRLGDHASVPELLERLDEDSDALVRAAALWALCELAGRSVGSDPEAWRVWYAAEEAWLRDEAPGLWALARAAEPETVWPVLRELQRHPLYRRESAAAVAALASRPDAAVARAACRALRALGSARAIPALVGALEHADDGVRAEAGDGLRSLTGTDLPDHPGAWRTWLRARG